MATHPCRVCGRLTVALAEREGRCPICQLYWQRHGVERVAAPWRPCATCGRLVPKLIGKRCTACYQYWFRTGRERGQRG
jgi:hypothetical protein